MNIAVLGLGIIGSAWAKNLIADGHSVRTWNRTPREFPNFCADIREAVNGAELVILVVADPPAVQSVLDQTLPVLKSGVVLMQSSTISAEWTKRFAQQVEATGADYLEAPFTGSKIAAEQRKTVYYLGGTEELVERSRSFLEPISSAVIHIGPLGSASTLKLAMNLNIAAVAQAMNESLSLCRTAGISDDTYFEALSKNVAKSGVSDLKETKLRHRDYSPQFSLKHMEKDLRLALETAANLNIELKQTVALRGSYEKGKDEGWADEDFIGLIRIIE